MAMTRQVDTFETDRVVLRQRPEVTRRLSCANCSSTWWMLTYIYFCYVKKEVTVAAGPLQTALHYKMNDKSDLVKANHR
jgi:hypothetical protein